ncbi:MAG: transposase [Planctomycetales bacterium]|nr:transposase [Planctomycetales bacterium]
MTECTQESFAFPPCQRRRVEARFEGGDITSDGGVLLLQQVDRRLGLNRAIADVIKDPRHQASCQHDRLRLPRKRLYGMALGYEDFNDHQTLLPLVGYEAGALKRRGRLWGRGSWLGSSTKQSSCWITRRKRTKRFSSSWAGRCLPSIPTWK